MILTTRALVADRTPGVFDSGVRAAAGEKACWKVGMSFERAVFALLYGLAEKTCVDPVRSG